MRKLTAKGLGLQLMVIIVTALLFISIYSIYNNYNRHIQTSREQTLEHLQSIAKTLVVTLDASNLDYIINTYKAKDAISSSQEDSVYFEMHKILRRVQVDNNIPTDIYILFRENGKFFFSVTSGVNPYYKHPYESHPTEINENYEKGAVFGPYSDKHGKWLSGFAPIKNKNGKTLGVVQVDMQFDKFLDEAWNELINDIITSSIVFVLIMALVIYIVGKLTQMDKKKTQQLEHAFDQLKIKNKDITDSINYARKIQAALIPSDNAISNHIGEHFILYEPKDVVSGDFPWFYKKDNYVYLAAVDCTGHGVPGAMMSIIGCLLLNGIIKQQGYPTPAELLMKLHKEVISTLSQEEEGSINDGMDAAICRVDITTNEVYYAGAHRPLYHSVGNEIKQYKGNKYPVGGTLYKGQNEFSDHIVTPQKGESIFFFSDGLPDQFDESGYKKFGPKRIRKMIAESDNFMSLKKDFRKAYLDWKGNYYQVDDILMIGIKF